MTSTTYITLNLQSPNTAVTVNAKQNDRLSRCISAALYDGSVTFVPPVGASAAIRYKKPDGTGGFYDADEDANPAIIITGSTALLTLAEQCTTVPGEVYMELNFYTATGDKLTSFTWLLKVEQSVLTDATIVSSDYYNVLTAAIATTLEYRDAAAASATAAAASAALALQISQQNKGWYPSAEALATAYPTGINGDWALVGGDIDTIWMWDSDSSAWKNTHQQTDLSNYYTKTQADTKFLQPTGTIVIYAGATAPAGWLVCNGANISRTTYAALFGILGTTYGAGDGSTTFAVPDMRGRVSVGIGASGVSVRGQVVGSQTQSLTAENNGPHSHVKATGYGIPGNDYSDPRYWGKVTSGTETGDVMTSSSGNGTPFSIMQPSLGVNYIIKT